MNRHSHQRGQIVWLLALCAIPIALAIAYLFNSAELLSRKMRAQNAADAAALSQATWIARSMNVMSTNNVAFTQVEAILVAESAVVLTAADLSQYQLREGAYQIGRAASSCPTVVGVLICADAVRIIISLYVSARELEDIVALALAADEFGDHAEAFAHSNDRLADNFAQFSADMQRSLAQSNGIADAPRVIAVGWKNKPNVQPDYAGTNLPVARIELWIPPSIADNNYSRLYQFMRTVNDNGYHGTHSVLLAPVARNFNDHGYDPDADEGGPWAMARNDVKDSLEDSEWWAKSTGWSASALSEEDPEYDDCWDMASTTPTIPVAFGVPVPCSNGVLTNPARAMRLYGPASPPGQDIMAWGVTDIVAFTRSTRKRGYSAPKRFVNGLPATYGLAKARVFNTTRPDLYSSDWHAVLVSTNSWNGSGLVLPPGFREALNKLLATEPELQKFMSRISDKDLPSVLAR